MSCRIYVLAYEFGSVQIEQSTLRRSSWNCWKGLPAQANFFLASFKLRLSQGPASLSESGGVAPVQVHLLCGVAGCK